MSGSYKVNFRNIEARKNSVGKVTSYRVSWTVDGEEFKPSFKQRAQADAFRSALMTAARNGERFSRQTGLPPSMAPSDVTLTWYSLAVRYLDWKWPYASPNHRRGIAESIIDATEVLLTSRPGKPGRTELRAAMLWTCSTRLQQPNTEPPAELARILVWLADHSILMAELAEPKTGPEVVRRILDRISRLQSGEIASASTTNRKRAVLHNVMEFAVEGNVLSANPLHKVRWARPKVSEEIDLRTVINADQAQRFFEALAALPHMGPRLVAFFGCMYHAALRPEEVIGLRRSALVSLPKSGWGELLLGESEPEPGARWTSSGTARERRGLKHRPVGSTRPVPLHPELVVMLREHLARFPNTTGYVFRGPRGGAIGDSAYLPYFHRARTEAFTTDEAASPLAPVPYALRHAAVSTWLGAGVPGPQVAEWAGHSVDVLYRVYAKCLAGGAEDAKRRILEATSSPGANDSDEGGPDEPAEDAETPADEPREP